MILACMRPQELLTARPRLMGRALRGAPVSYDKI